LSPLEDPENSAARATDGIRPPFPYGSRFKSKAQELPVEQPPAQKYPAREHRTQESTARKSSTRASSTQESSRRLRDTLPRALGLPNALFGVDIRTPVTVGFLAAVALLLVILVLDFRRPDPASSFAADVQRFTAALPPASPDRQPRDQPSNEDVAKPAIEQLRGLLASPGGPAAQADRDPSDELLLRRFMEWRLKSSSAENAQ
jgi:hypothetical protein